MYRLSTETASENWVHLLHYFYTSIADQELRNYEVALTNFDRPLAAYSKFSEAFRYKIISHYALGQKTEDKKAFQWANTYHREDFSFNEDNAAYEPYPYQVQSFTYGKR